MLEAAILVIFPFCMAFAAISDLLSMTIANRVSLLLVGSQLGVVAVELRLEVLDLVSSLLDALLAHGAAAARGGGASRRCGARGR